MYSLAEARYDADGRLERIVGVMRDITERKRFELELARAKDAAQAASRAKSEFLANMSHELRTPLNGVMGVASALAGTSLDQRQREMLGLIETSSQALEGLLTDILDLTRVESGRMELHAEPVDLQALVHGVSTLFQWRARDQGLGFSCEVAPAAQGVYLADPVRLRQILTNLVSNAIKFTTSGEISVRVDVTRRVRRPSRCATPGSVSIRANAPACSAGSSRPTPPSPGGWAARVWALRSPVRWCE